MGYCVKCMEKREMKEAEKVARPAMGGATRPAMKGKCAVCGTTLATPTGGKARIEHEVVETVEHRPENSIEQ